MILRWLLCTHAAALRGEPGHKKEARRKMPTDLFGEEEVLAAVVPAAVVVVELIDRQRLGIHRSDYSAGQNGQGDEGHSKGLHNHLHWIVLLCSCVSRYRLATMT